MPGGVIHYPNIEETSKLLNDKIRNTIVKNGPGNPVSELILPPGFPVNFQEGTINPSSDENFWPKFGIPIVVKDWKTVSEAKLRSGWSSRTQCELYIAARYNDIVDRKGQKTQFKITQSGAVIVEKDRSDGQEPRPNGSHRSWDCPRSISQPRRIGRAV